MSVRVKLQKEAFQEKGASNQGLRTCPVPARKRHKTLHEIRKLAAEGVEVGVAVKGRTVAAMCAVSSRPRLGQLIFCSR